MMRDRALSLLISPTSPLIALGIVVAVALIAADTLVAYRGAPIGTGAPRASARGMGSASER